MHIKRYKEIYAKEPLTACMGKVGGEFRLVLRDENEQVIQDTGWFDNIITNTGLVTLGSFGSTWHANGHIGSSGTAPAFTDTALGSWLAVGSNISNVNGPVPVAPNYQFYSTKAWRFNAGVGTGTIRELGISPNSGNSGMVIRALVSPSVDKLANQVLDVYYRFTVWPTLTDTIGTVTIAGDLYNYTMRAANVNNGAGLVFAPFGLQSSTSTGQLATGNIGAVTTEPSGNLGSNGYASRTVIASGSGFNDNQLYWGLDAGNVGGGIRSAFFRSALNFTGDQKGFQVQFDRDSDGEKILKDNTKELYMVMKVTWARH